MANRTDSLDLYARALGFSSEREMLENLYIKMNLSLTAISRILQVRSSSNVRIRLLRFGIKLRPRGGATRLTSRKEVLTPNGTSTDRTHELP